MMITSAQNPLDAELELAAHQAHDAVELVGGDLQSAAERAQCGSGDLIAGLVEPARCSGSMDMIDRSESVDAEPIDKAVAQQVALLGRQGDSAERNTSTREP